MKAYFKIAALLAVCPLMTGCPASKCVPQKLSDFPSELSDFQVQFRDAKEALAFKITCFHSGIFTPTKHGGFIVQCTMSDDRYEIYFQPNGDFESIRLIDETTDQSSCGSTCVNTALR